MKLFPSQNSLVRLARAPYITHVLRWALVCWVVVFWRLDYVALLDDGAHYAQLTREMIQQGSWLVPLLDGSPFIDKPVLFHWLQGAAFYVLGENETAARLPSALSAILLFVLTRFLGRRLFEPAAGERAWLMLATVPATFVLSRVGYLDMLFTVSTFGSIACLVTAGLQGGTRLQYVGYAALVLAVMTKGPVALALVGTFFALGWLVDRDCRRALQTLDWRTGLVLVVLGAAPWFVWMHDRFGDAFIQGYVMLGHTFYLAPRSSASSTDHAFYLEMFVMVFFPWSLVVIGYLVDTIRRRRAGVPPPTAEKLLWIWIASVLLLFTAARFRVDRYIFPAAPAVCLLAARAWLSAKRDETECGSTFTRFAIFASAVVLAVAGVVVGIRLPAIGVDVPVLAFLLPLTLSLGGTVLAVAMWRNQFRPPAVLNMPIGTLISVYALLVVTGFPLVEQVRPTRQVGQWLQSTVRENESVGLYALDRWQPALRYYGTHPLQRLDSADAAREFLTASSNRWVVTRRDAFAGLRAVDPSVEIAFAVPAVVGTSGTGIRRQIWNDVVVARRGR